MIDPSGSTSTHMTPWHCQGVTTAWETPSLGDRPDRHCALKVRVINVVDLMRLLPETEHPHGLSDCEFDALFTTDRPIIFAFHGYPWLIHRLTIGEPTILDFTSAVIKSVAPRRLRSTW